MKLTIQEVREIRRRKASGERADSIARDFEISISYVHLLANNYYRIETPRIHQRSTEENNAAGV